MKEKSSRDQKANRQKEGNRVDDGKCNRKKGKRERKSEEQIPTGVPTEAA
jgi:hypothetical protein